MNKPESKVLSLLREGDMLRFVFTPDAVRGMDIHLEGAVSPDGDRRMQDRMEIAVRELRGEGYLFGNGCRPSNLSAGRRSRGHKTKPRWLEIRPVAREFSSIRQGSVGFDTVSTAHEVRGVYFPTVLSNPETSLSDSIASLVQNMSPIQRFEIDFTRTSLPADTESLLQELLTMRKSVRHVFGDENGSMGLPDAFFSLWLIQKTGWQVTARALILARRKSPLAALEMIGREIFHCECQILEKEPPDRDGDSLDLGCHFPQGWPFPALLPPPHSSDGIAVRRFHNLRLPNLPRQGMRIGTADEADVRLPDDARARHLYIVGATGTGKSTLLARMIREDMHSGKGVILLDPHGDLYNEMLDAVPEKRRKDVLWIDPSNPEACPALNILDIPQSGLKERHTELLISELVLGFKEMWDNTDAFGPMFDFYFRNAIRLLILQKTETCTLASFDRVFSERDFRKTLLAGCTCPVTVRFWEKMAEQAGGEASLANVAPYIASKVNPIVQGSFLSRLLTAPKDEVNLSKRINRSPIILVNLNKGMLGVQEARLLGVILMTKIMSAGLERSLIPRQRRKPVHIYVDEFQNFVSDSMASMLSEARKFGLRLHLANQTLAQLQAGHGRQNLLETILGNVGTLILFRLGVPDAERMQLFLEPFSRQEIQELANFHALVRMTTTEGPIRPFIMRTLSS